MSYLVLARKYRPMTFDELVGQEHVAKTLKNAIEMNRLANAYLFSGPRGIGKTTVARILAKAINCEKGPTPTPCNQCTYCSEIIDGRSLEVQEIDGASNRGIDEIRNLRDGLRYAPAPGKYKIYIIDEVHMLTTEAFNALLKTLEEPPRNVLFIFATTEPNKVLATILSRCQRFEFRRMSSADIIRQLEMICRTEKLDIDAESLRLIAEKAEGGMRDALSLLDQVISFTGTTIRFQDILGILGIIHQDLYFQVTDAIKNGDVGQGLAISQLVFTEGHDAGEFLNGLSEHFRNFLVAQTTPVREQLQVSDEHAQRYLSTAADFTAEDLLRYIKITSETAYGIRRSVNPRLRLEVALTKLIKLDKSLSLSELMQQMEVLKKKPEPVIPVKTVSTPIAPKIAPAARPPIPVKPAPAPEPVRVETAPKPSLIQIDLTAVEAHWVEIVEAVKTKKIALGSFLSEGWPTKVADQALEITFSKNNGFHIDSIEKNRRLIQEVIAQILGVNLRILCKKDEQGILDQVRKIEFYVDKNKAFEKIVAENPTIKSMLNRLDAELI